MGADEAQLLRLPGLPDRVWKAAIMASRLAKGRRMAACSATQGACSATSPKRSMKAAAPWH
jgi:hypothetical protein